MFVHFSLASMLLGGTDEYAELDTWFEKQTAFEQMDRYGTKNSKEMKAEYDYARKNIIC